jgi:CRISPR-associated exonuclease Cas4
MEHTSELVSIGKIVDENSYSREGKGIDIDAIINIDWFDKKNGVIHEVKKSKSVEIAHEMQVLYYIWYLKQKGVEGITGEIDYPLLKQKSIVVLTEEKEKELLQAMAGIDKVVSLEVPPDRIEKKFCIKCSYYELCWS